MTARNSNQENVSTVSPDRKAPHSRTRHLRHLSSNRPGQTDIRRNGLQYNSDHSLAHSCSCRRISAEIRGF